MNRPIKFRGRDIDTGEFVYAELGQVSAEISDEYLSFITDDMHLVDADTIAQLVGFDRNGREVYEGDTVVIPCCGTEIAARLINNLTVNCKLKEATT